MGAREELKERERMRSGMVVVMLVVMTMVVGGGDDGDGEARDRGLSERMGTTIHEGGSCLLPSCPLAAVRLILQLLRRPLLMPS